MFGILFFLMMTGTVLLSLLINTIFLEPYYKTERKNALIHVYRELQNASVEDLLETDDFDLTPCVDHIIPWPICADRFFDRTNLQALCDDCNHEKGQKDKKKIQEWKRQQAGNPCG